MGKSLRGSLVECTVSRSGDLRSCTYNMTETLMWANTSENAGFGRGVALPLLTDKEFLIELHEKPPSFMRRDEAFRVLPAGTPPNDT